VMETLSRAAIGLGMEGIFCMVMIQEANDDGTIRPIGD
jgi:hypothetical protein